VGKAGDGHDGAARKKAHYDARCCGSSAYAIPIREFEPEGFELACGRNRDQQEGAGLN